MHYTTSLSSQALGRAIYILSGTVVFVFLARALGPEAFGSYVYAVNLINIAAAVADLGSTAILARDIVAAGEDRAAYAANYIALRAVLGGAVAVLAAAATLSIAPPELRPVLLLCCPFLPLVAARFFDPIFQVTGRPWLSFRLALGYGGVMVAASLAAASLAAAPVPWTVAAYAACGVLYGVAGLWLTGRLIRPDFRAVSLRAMRRVAAAVGPFGVSSLFAMLSARLDIFIVAEFGSVEMVGQYNAAFRFVDLGMAVIITVLTPLVTVFARFAGGDRARMLAAFHAAMRFVATWSTLAAVLAPTLAPLVVRVLYGAAYAPAATVLDLLAWKVQIAFANLLLFALLMTVTSIRFVWWSTGLALLANLALNLALVPVLGMTGAAVGAVATELVQIAVNLVFALRAQPGVVETGWWGRLLAAALAGSAVAYLPLGLDPLWLALPTGGMFLGMLKGLRALPANPLPLLEASEAAA